MLKIQTISSGSAGNITYVGSATTNILVDVGLPLSQTLKLLTQAKIDPHRLHGIVITHEHSDHIKGVADLVSQYNLPIYCYHQVSRILKKNLKLPPHFFHEVDAEFMIGDLTINCFPVPHDSQFCLGYTFTCDDACVGIATDIGQVTNTILNNLSRCQIVVIEANHDIQKLMTNPKYPEWLKRRILGNRGHLSNIDCARAVTELCHNYVSQIILAHLSEKNNTPLLAYQTVKQYLKNQGIIEGQDVFIDVALQSQIGNCYVI